MNDQITSANEIREKALTTIFRDSFNLSILEYYLSYQLPFRDLLAVTPTLSNDAVSLLTAVNTQ